MKIIGTGHYLPLATLSNADLSRRVTTSDEWITSRTGIKNRHISREENTSDLAFFAAERALLGSTIGAGQIELVIVATTTPDCFVPGVSHQLINRLQIPQSMAFDLNAACTGFVYALDTAMALMEARKFRYALVVGAETLSKIVDWEDRETCILFGDGAGAVVLENDGANPVLYSRSCAVPDTAGTLFSGGIALNNPLVSVPQGKIAIGMKGQEVFKFAVSKVCESIDEALASSGIPKEEIDFYVLHQANLRILDYVAKRQGLPKAKLYSTIDRTGNTSAASIPIALDELNGKGLLKKGMKILLCGFGAGLTYSAMIIEW